MAFASGLSLADLSDYLAPSQACIMPVTEVEAPIVLTPSEIASKKASSAATEIMIDSEHGYHEISELGDIRQKLKKAEITIEDCLACSGCVTSEESILVAMQSDEEVYRVLREEPELIPILSLSPQSIASLAALHNLTIDETFRGLKTFFKKELGFKLVFDTTFAREISLSENRREFLERKLHASSTSTSSRSTSLSSTIVNEYSPSTSSNGPLPILSSACPGWICLAEKKYGDLLPFVSNVKSSQAIMGTLIKGGKVAKSLKVKPQQIYHVTVMPCFDKKLEASRLDFTTPFDLTQVDSLLPLPTTTGIRDVDCVLTTGEVQKMLNSKSLSLLELSKLPLTLKEQELEIESNYFPSLLSTAGSSSGGYLFNTIQSVLNTLSLEELYSTRMIEKRLKSDDHISFTLLTNIPSNSSTSTSTISIPKIQLRAAKCYGLNHLQNLTRKITQDSSLSSPSTSNTSTTPNDSNLTPQEQRNKNRLIASKKMALAKAKRLALKNSSLATNTSSSEKGGEGGENDYSHLPYDFVEIMACPSGCINGGGQILTPTIPLALNRKKLPKRRKLDLEGMIDFSENIDMDMELDEEELEKKLFSGKEWVNKVEEVYWEIGENDWSLNLDQMGEKRKEGGGGGGMIDWNKIDKSLLPYLISRNRKDELSLGNLTEIIIEDLVAGKGEEKRKELLRTSYRVVEGQTNGFAVEW